jgi:phosphoribosylglycinamide formyltransferase-1
MKRRLAVLLSGRGTNFEAIHRATVSGELDAEIAVVISNKPDARGLELARQSNLPAVAVEPGRFSSREDHELEVLRIIQESRADLVVLAGYMRRLTPTLIEPLRNRIVNIHPSLLPAFPGLGAQAQALAHGVRVSGCTVHFVDETLDDGAIILQRCVPVLEDDSEESLSARILEQEHVAYVEALQKLMKPYRIEGRRVIFS